MSDIEIETVDISPLDKKRAYNRKYMHDKAYVLSDDIRRAKWCEANKRYRSKNREKLAEYQRNRRAKNPDIARAANLMSHYKLTIEQWNNLFNSQNRCCAICKCTEPGNRRTYWHTDHCHKTGKVRGILCHHCNLTVGHSKDDIERLKQIISYLESTS